MTTQIFAPGFPENVDIAKAQARRLSKALEPHCKLSHSQVLELVARTHGERSWGAMSSSLSNSPTTSDGYDLGYRHFDRGEAPPDRNHRGWTTTELERFVELLRSHQVVRTKDSYRVRLDKVIADGCVPVGSVDTLLDAASSDLGDFAFAMPGARLVELFGIKTESYVHRPDETSDSTSGYQAISVAGAAALMMRLERLGLDTHPEHLVNAVNVATSSRLMLTSHELECLWYRSEKQGSGRQRLMAGAFQEDSEAEGETFVAATGYKCTVYPDDAGQIEVVTIDPPHTRA